MGKNEILENLPKLTSEERYEIRLKLAEWMEVAGLTTMTR